MKAEAKLQSDVVNYLNTYYPKVIYFSDISSGMHLPMHMAATAKRLQCSRGMPDLYIFAPCGKYHGLMIELKKDGTKLKRDKDAADVLKGEFKLRKAGDWWDDHIEEQARMIASLQKLGYRADFGVGFGGTVKIINEYLNV